MTSTDTTPAVDETPSARPDPRAASRNQWLWLGAIGVFALGAPRELVLPIR